MSLYTHSLCLVGPRQYLTLNHHHFPALENSHQPSSSHQTDRPRLADVHSWVLYRVTAALNSTHRQTLKAFLLGVMLQITAALRNFL